MQYNPFELNNYIINLLTNHIRKNEIIECRNIQAVYPIISILFYDQTRTEIFVQIKGNSTLNEQNSNEMCLLSDFHEPIHGVRNKDCSLIIMRVKRLKTIILIFNILFNFLNR